MNESPEREIAMLMDRFMRRTHAGIHAKAKAFDTERVGPNGGMMLLALSDLQPAPISELAREVTRDKAQVTRAIQRFERLGLVKRQTLDDDARVSLLSLTSKGETFVEGIRVILTDTLEALLAPCNTEDRASIKRILQLCVGSS
ncbi:MAG: MarR family transcriptional regulator [Pseudomonadota bacterium]